MDAAATVRAGTGGGEEKRRGRGGEAGHEGGETKGERVPDSAPRMRTHAGSDVVGHAGMCTQLPAPGPAQGRARASPPAPRLCSH